MRGGGSAGEEEKREREKSREDKWTKRGVEDHDAKSGGPRGSLPGGNRPREQAAKMAGVYRNQKLEEGK